MGVGGCKEEQSVKTTTESVKKNQRTTEQRERKFTKVRKCPNFCAASRAVGIF